MPTISLDTARMIGRILKPRTAKGGGSAVAVWRYQTVGEASVGLCGTHLQTQSPHWLTSLVRTLGICCQSGTVTNVDRWNFFLVWLKEEDLMHFASGQRTTQLQYVAQRRDIPTCMLTTSLPKIDNPHSVAFLGDPTLIFEWYVVGCGLTNRYQEGIMGLREIVYDKVF
jgi:hypothetical protein